MTLFSDILSIPSNPEDIFTLLNPIGHGAFGYVYKAIHNQSKKVYAIKIINYFKENINFTENKTHINNINFCYQTVQQETSLMKKVSCSNYILKYYGSYFSRKTNSLWLIIEFCSFGSTIDLMFAMNRMYTEIEVATIIKMVLQGLIIIHEKNLIHRDIKGANILLSEDGYAKLGDFGVGTKLLDENFRSSIKGSPYWMSPQVIQKEKYDNKTDIWSLGITCVELLQGEPPYSELSPNEVMEKIGNKNFNFDDFFRRKKSNYSSEFINFISQCLQVNPEKRVSAKELIKHNFITKFAKNNFFLKKLLKQYEKDMDNYRKEFEEREFKLNFGFNNLNNIFFNSNSKQMLYKELNLNDSFFNFSKIINNENERNDSIMHKKSNIIANKISPKNPKTKLVYRKVYSNREKQMNYSLRLNKNRSNSNIFNYKNNKSILRNNSFIIFPKNKNKPNRSRNKENMFSEKNDINNYTNNKCQIINFDISMKKTLNKALLINNTVYVKKIIVNKGIQGKSCDKKYDKINSYKKIKTINSNINTDMNTNNTNSINNCNSIYNTKKKINLKMKVPNKRSINIIEDIPNLNLEQILNKNRSKLNLFQEPETNEDINESNDNDYIINKINNYTINKYKCFDKENNKNILNLINDNKNSENNKNNIIDTIHSCSIPDSKDTFITIHSSNINLNEQHKKYC